MSTPTPEPKEAPMTTGTALAMLAMLATDATLIVVVCVALISSEWDKAAAFALLRIALFGTKR